MARLKPVVAAILLLLPGAGHAQDGLDDLFVALRSAQGADAEKIADKIASEWARSGSPSMDMLLTRGREALEEGDTAAALDHLGALVDHAPNFAEGYHSRATVYFQDRQLGLAMSDLEAALALNPRHFGALAGLGIIAEDLGYDLVALEAWRQVLELYPDHLEAQRATQRLSLLVEGQTL